MEIRRALRISAVSRCFVLNIEERESLQKISVCPLQRTLILGRYALSRAKVLGHDNLQGGGRGERERENASSASTPDPMM